MSQEKLAKVGLDHIDSLRIMNERALGSAIEVPSNMTLPFLYGYNGMPVFFFGIRRLADHMRVRPFSDDLPTEARLSLIAANTSSSAIDSDVYRFTSESKYATRCLMQVARAETLVANAATKLCNGSRAISTSTTSSTSTSCTMANLLPTGPSLSGVDDVHAGARADELATVFILLTAVWLTGVSVGFYVILVTPVVGFAQVS